MKTFAITALVASFALASCASGGHATIPASSPTEAGTHPTASARLAIVIPLVAPSTSARRPEFVSASTRSGTLTVNGSQPQTLDLSATGIGCGQDAASRTCTIAVKLPIGSDTLALATYNGAVVNGNVSGALLAKAQMTQTIVEAQSNDVAMSLLGVPAAVTLQLDNSTPPVGTAGDYHLTARVNDPSGAHITSDAYLTPITVASDDTSGRVTLDKTTFAGPTDVITVHYSGKLLPTPVHIAVTSPVQSYAPAASVTFAATPFTTFGPVTYSNVGALAAGPGGLLWFVECQVQPTTCKIATITMTGTITELANVPLASGLAAGPDGNMWFTEGGRNFLGRITPSGIVTDFPIPSGHPVDAGPIVAGPDGNIWFAEGDRIGMSTPAGAITEFLIGGLFRPTSLVVGTDGNLWFSEGQQIGRITTAGVVTQFPVDNSGYYSAGQLVFGPSNTMYFPNTGTSGALWSMTTSGSVNKTSLLPRPYSMAPLPQRSRDGLIVGYGANYDPYGYAQGAGLITLDTNGTTTLYLAERPQPLGGSYGGGAAAWGPDGNVWQGYGQGLLRFTYAP